MDITCVCGKQFELSRDYLAEHGGTAFDCDCGQGLIVPSIEVGTAGVKSAHESAAEVVLIEDVCSDGNFVVVSRGAHMPDRCRKCNAPITDARQQTLKWVPPDARGTDAGMFGRLMASVLADSQSRSVVVRIGLCPKHRRGLSLRMMSMLVIILGTAALAAAPKVPSSYVGAMGWAAAGLFLLAVVVWRMDPSIVIDKVHGNRFWISGFGRAYRDALPPFREVIADESAAVAANFDQIE